MRYQILSVLFCPQITPPDYDSEIVYPLPQVVFRMFDYTDVYSADDDAAVDDEMPQDGSKISSLNTPTLPGAHTIERFLVDEQIHIILETMHFNRVMWCVALLVVVVLIAALLVSTFSL